MRVKRRIVIHLRAAHLICGFYRIGRYLIPSARGRKSYRVAIQKQLVAVFFTIGVKLGKCLFAAALFIERKAAAHLIGRKPAAEIAFKRYYRVFARKTRKFRNNGVCFFKCRKGQIAVIRQPQKQLFNKRAAENFKRCFGVFLFVF